MRRSVLASLVGLVACTPPRSSQACDACGGACVEDFIPARSADHVEGAIDYADNPPTGGDHSACWAQWGVHAEVMPPERWVHNLEHGGVVFLFDCPDGCETERQALADHVASLPPGRALLTGASGMPARFAAVAWEHRLLLDCLDLEALDAFFAARVGQGPEDLGAGPPDSCPP